MTCNRNIQTRWYRLGSVDYSSFLCTPSRGTSVYILHSVVPLCLAHIVPRDSFMDLSNIRCTFVLVFRLSHDSSNHSFCVLCTCFMSVVGLCSGRWFLNRRLYSHCSVSSCRSVFSSHEPLHQRSIRTATRSENGSFQSASLCTPPLVPELECCLAQSGFDFPDRFNSLFESLHW